MSTQMPQPGEVVAGKYKIVQLLGQGGMGAVYAATHTLTGKRVALKWLLPELACNVEIVQRFLREAQAAARVEHPNVVDVYDVCNDKGAHFLVMEWLDGLSLGAAIERGALSAGQVIQILLQAAEGVAAAHRVGVIHRDIKPDNVFLCRDANDFVRDVKVLDFGISKLSDPANTLGDLTQTGATMGTPHYMAPEQLRGSKDIDGRADIYSFGIILYEALTGRKPFEADTFGALAMAVVSQTPPAPRETDPQIAPELEHAVMKAISRHPADRFWSAPELIEAVRPFAASGPISLRVGAASEAGRDPRSAPLLRSPTPPGSHTQSSVHTQSAVASQPLTRGASVPATQSAAKVLATVAATSHHAAARASRKRLNWAAACVAALGMACLLAWLTLSITQPANDGPSAAPATPTSAAPVPAAGPAVPATTPAPAASHAAQVPAMLPPTAAKPVTEEVEGAHEQAAARGQRARGSAAQVARDPRGSRRGARAAGVGASSRQQSPGTPSSSTGSSAPASESPADPAPPATRKPSRAVERVGDLTLEEF